MSYLKKIQQAKELLLEAEAEMLSQKGCCFYEIGYAIRSIDETIAQIKEGTI